MSWKKTIEKKLKFEEAERVERHEIARRRGATPSLLVNVPHRNPAAMFLPQPAASENVQLFLGMEQISTSRCREFFFFLYKFSQLSAV